MITPCLGSVAWLSLCMRWVCIWALDLVLFLCFSTKNTGKYKLNRDDVFDYSWRNTIQIISIACGCLSLLFLITPEPERNATNKLLLEKIVEDVLPSEAEMADFPG